MQRFSAWARWLAVSAFTVFVIPLAVEFFKHLAENVGLYDRPREAVGTVLNFLLSLADLPWLRVAALILFGLMAGLWVDWLLRKLDDTRADKGKVLGGEMVRLGNYVEQYKFPIPMEESTKIRSCFGTATKLGIWAPADQVFDLARNDHKRVIAEYLITIGQMLKAGHFKEAKRDAKNSKAKARFDN